MQKKTLEVATFAGGCFWCIESAFAHVEGVKKTLSGLTGGTSPTPTYEQVHHDNGGHVEAVRVWYDSNIVKYNRLLEIFWLQIDPTDDGGQFVDRGEEYRTVIFYHNEEQKKLAESSKQELERLGKYDKKIVTKIKEAGEFFEAEEYHQGYFKKYPNRYKLYRLGSGRSGYIQKTWGDDKPNFTNK